MRQVVIMVVVLGSILSGCQCGPPVGACATDGTGTIEVTSTGLPTGVAASIQLSGPTEQVVTASGPVSVSAGTWSVSTSLVTAADPRVRQVFRGEVTAGNFCLEKGTTQAVEVRWSLVPTSRRLWALNQNATAQLAGVDSALLATSTATPAPVTAAVKGPIGGDLAFDREGNLWGTGATTSDPTLVRFSAASLAASGAAQPDYRVTITGGCLPFARSLAFGPQGDLYVGSPCSDAVFKVPAAELAQTTELPATRTLTPASFAVPDPGGLAFDAEGNLWVASLNADQVWRFDAASLAAGGALTPSLKLGVFARDVMGDTSRFRPSWLAFDANGDLWANDFGANIFYRVPKAELAGTGEKTVQPAVRVVVSVLAVLEGFFFDESGGLWSAGSLGRVVRLSPAQLTTSTTSGSPTIPETVIASDDFGSVGNLASYPAPAALPLFHRLP